MSERNIFEVAVRGKLRFPFKGNVSVEDLFDLNVNDLDSIFKTLNSQVKKVKEESLLTTKTKEDETLSTMIDIVKYIVSDKLAEEHARLQAKEIKEKKQKVMEILAAKQDSDLQNLSVKELQDMLNKLND